MPHSEWHSKVRSGWYCAAHASLLKMKRLIVNVLISFSFERIIHQRPQQECISFAPSAHSRTQVSPAGTSSPMKPEMH